MAELVVNPTIHYVTRGTGTITWAQLKAVAGDSANFNTNQSVGADDGDDGSNWSADYRSHMVFDLSSLPAGADISAAVLELYVGSEDVSFDFSYRVVGSDGTTAAEGALQNADHQAFVEGEVFSAADLTHAAITVNQYNSITFSAAGRALLEAAAASTIRMTVMVAELLDGTEPTHINGFEGGGFTYKHRSDTNPPKLTITYTTETAEQAALRKRIPVMGTIPTLPGISGRVG